MNIFNLSVLKLTPLLEKFLSCENFQCVVFYRFAHFQDLVIRKMAQSNMIRNDICLYFIPAMNCSCNDLHVNSVEWSSEETSNFDKTLNDKIFTEMYIGEYLRR